MLHISNESGIVALFRIPILLIGARDIDTQEIILHQTIIEKDNLLALDTGKRVIIVPIQRSISRHRTDDLLQEVDIDRIYLIGIFAISHGKTSALECDRRGDIFTTIRSFSRLTSQVYQFTVTSLSAVHVAEIELLEQQYILLVEFLIERLLELEACRDETRFRQLRLLIDRIQFESRENAYIQDIRQRLLVTIPERVDQLIVGRVDMDIRLNHDRQDDDSVEQQAFDISTPTDRKIMQCTSQEEVHCCRFSVELQIREELKHYSDDAQNKHQHSTYAVMRSPSVGEIAPEEDHSHIGCYIKGSQGQHKEKNYTFIGIRSISSSSPSRLRAGENKAERAGSDKDISSSWHSILDNISAKKAPLNPIVISSPW